MRCQTFRNGGSSKEYGWGIEKFVQEIYSLTTQARRWLVMGTLKTGKWEKENDVFEASLAKIDRQVQCQHLYYK